MNREWGVFIFYFLIKRHMKEKQISQNLYCTVFPIDAPAESSRCTFPPSLSPVGVFVESAAR